jgi:hypothetical protein
MTYHPILRWRCLRCGVSGEITHSLEEAVDIRWERVLTAHALASPFCAEEAGDAGIAVQAPQGAYPEAS